MNRQRAEIRLLALQCDVAAYFTQVQKHPASVCFRSFKSEQGNRVTTVGVASKD